MKPTRIRRTSSILAAGALLVAGTAMLPAHDDDTLPRAETLLDRHVEATGGKQAHLAIKTRKKVGRLAIDIAGHKLDATVEDHAQAPDKSHSVIDGTFYSRVSVCNGKDAWEWAPGHSHEEGADNTPKSSLLAGVEKARAIERGRFHAAVEWRNAFEKARTLRVVQVEGKPAYEVQVTTKSGEEYSQFYDKADGRLVKVTRTVDSPPMGTVKMEIFFEDYRELDGVWIAMKRREHLESSTFGKGTQLWTYSKIEHNEKIAASLFEMPDELKSAAGK